MNSNLEKYLELLTEIKGRTIVIENLQFNGKKRINDVHVEFACLQIRKILELIAFGSLISNMELYSKEYDKFSKFWNAELMLKDMRNSMKNDKKVDDFIRELYKNDLLSLSEFNELKQKIIDLQNGKLLPNEHMVQEAIIS